MENINKNEVIENLKRNESIMYDEFYTCSLEGLERYSIPYMNQAINERKEEIELLLIEIEALNQEKEKRENLIKDLKSRETKTIINIIEKPKKDKFDYYALKLELIVITNDSEEFLIKNISSFDLGFGERISKRNSILLDWIKINKIDEVRSNVNIDKFLMENKIENINIIYK